MATTKTTSDGESFEDALERLEAIVAELERGELALDDAFEAFEEGVALARACRERLTAVEGRVAELLEDGAVVAADDA